MKILVTGNCGFIGQNFVRMYRNQHEIIGLDKLGYASDKKAIDLCPTIFGDIEKPIFVNNIIKDGKFDCIINMCAESHVDNSISSPAPFVYSNYIGVFNLLEAIRKYNVPLFYQISTDEVFGDLQPNDPPFSNDHLLKPSSPYSATKASADLLVMSYNRTYGINALISRCCNNYGPYQYIEKFIPVIITKSLKNEKIPLYGSGTNIREWIYVDDHCKAIMDILQNGKSGEMYNIGTGVEYSNIDMIKIILKIMGKSESLIEYVTDRKGHDRRYALNCEKTYKEINWKHETTFEEGINKTIQWYLDNPNYWGNHENK